MSNLNLIILDDSEFGQIELKNNSLADLYIVLKNSLKSCDDFCDCDNCEDCDCIECDDGNDCDCIW